MLNCPDLGNDTPVNCGRTAIALPGPANTSEPSGQWQDGAVPSARPVVSRRRVLVSAAALSALGLGAAACGKPPPPPDLDDLTAQLDLAKSDSQLANDAAATAKPPLKPALEVVANERSDHARALSDEIARMTGEPAASSTTSTTTTTSAETAPPTVKDVVAALRKSADSAGQVAAQLSGYRAGLLGSIAASCAAAYTVALPGSAP
jgi:hypothetical protein